ncbi:UDP-glucuronosyltransferase 1-1-like [Empidonax traillii]|uniref:UDP-glucuronosyltransferase 1-1-like n=1 Tax=Empidonax traillii TaxID=164674 RepID=UPI000FFD55F9|nr:UDP-glucuronosyltransferase 1-1-like [Empidonax traillii]
MLRALLLPFLCLLGPASAGKLLVIPMEGSHWLSMREVLAELNKRGHEIVVLAPDNKMLIDSSDVYELKTYPVPIKKEEMEALVRSFGSRCFSEEPFLIRFWNILKDSRKSGNMFESTCRALLYNEEVMKYIQDSKFDAIFTDPFNPCGQIIAVHFSIPSIFFMRGVPCNIDIQAAQGPDPPSYVPRMFSLLTDRMTFSQRVKNFLIFLSESFSCSVAFSPFEELASEFLHREVTVLDLLRQGSVWLLRVEFVMDYPRPLMPNIIPIGGVHCAHKKLTQVGLV